MVSLDVRRHGAVYLHAVAARTCAKCGDQMSMLQPDHDDEDHVPHLMPADPIVKVTRLDVALALFAVCAAIVYLALKD